MTIRDSRHLHGARTHAHPDDVRAQWASHEEVRRQLGGFASRPESASLERVGETVAAYVSDNRWVADCPHCRGGIACWSEMPDGCCYDCGRIYTVEFPEGWQHATQVLEHRPAEHRHWFPGRETVAHLKAENATRGLAFTTGGDV